MDEKVDLTVENNPMPARVSRMIDELTPLVYRINSLSTFLDEHEPGQVTEDGEEIKPEEYDWMVNQYLGMVAYANALENRINICGYNVNVIKDPMEEND